MCSFRITQDCNETPAAAQQVITCRAQLSLARQSFVIYMAILLVTYVYCSIISALAMSGQVVLPSHDKYVKTWKLKLSSKTNRSKTCSLSFPEFNAVFFLQASGHRPLPHKLTNQLIIWGTVFLEMTLRV
jgi:hypothetical protein